jgi:(1->4)-alpha-D-glucan 1-alpha-D-glucosylmutase
MRVCPGTPVRHGIIWDGTSVLFRLQGAYRVLTARGAKAAHVVACAQGEGAVTVVPRLVMGLGDRWGDTALALPAGCWYSEPTGDKCDGGEIRLAELL